MIKHTRGTTSRTLTSGAGDDGKSDVVHLAVSRLAANRNKHPNQAINWNDTVLTVGEARSVLLEEIRQAELQPISGDLWRARFELSLVDHGIPLDRNGHLEYEMSDVPEDYLYAAPANPQRQGRFHGPMEECLYLGTDLDHLALEVSQDCMYGEYLIGRFNLPEPYGQFLSILPEDTPNPAGLNALAMESERARIGALAAGQDHPYVGTQWLRQLLRDEFPDIDGVIYPPVHGTYAKNRNGKNVAVFSEKARDHIYSCGPKELIRRSLHMTWSEGE